MRITVSSLALLLGSVVVAAPVPKALQRANDFYPSTVGTKWVYTYEDGSNEHTREVTASKTDEKGTTDFTITWKQGAATQIWELKKDATGTYRTKQDTLTFDPPHKLLPEKVADGVEWESEYSLGGGRAAYKYSRAIGKPEVVKVPAGEFTAYPIVSRNLNVNGDKTTLWYVDGVGLIKIQHESDTPIVLREFTRGGK